MNPLSRLLVSATIVAMCTLPAHAASFKQAKKHYAAADYAAAITELQPLAKAGNADASNLLGEMYLQGVGVNTDMALAKTYFEAGARVGHLAALANLGDILNREYKVELVTLEPLAQAGNAQAQNRLGRMYEFGQGHSINPQAAYTWYKKAADQGHMDGRMNLARAHNFGLGTKQDFVKAEAGYLANAKAGHIDSMFFLGTMHFAQVSQAGLDSDRQAYAWLKVAAQNGHATAAAMVTRLAIKLGDNLGQGDALYQEYATSYTSDATN